MNKEKKEKESVFECSICFDTAKEPVVTKCGHLFCWACLYDWLESKGSQAFCPNCRSGINKETLTPIYTKEENTDNAKKFNIPKRPKGKRMDPPQQNNSGWFSNSNFQAFGFSPFFGGFSFNFGGNNNMNFSNDSNRHSEFDNLPENTKKAITNLLILLFLIYLSQAFWI